MTGRFLRGPIMRPHRCWAVLQVSILAGLLLTLNADGEDCEVELKVHRNTIYGGNLGGDLEIDCTVTFCNNPPPTVSWYKLEKAVVPVNVSSSSHIKTEWKLSDHLKGKSILIFQKLLRSDSGVYQCGDGSSVSHNINVTVHDDGGHTNVSQENNTTVDSEPTEVDIWKYMYVAPGIVAFVIIVIIISVVSMRGCKGKPKKETPTENQYMAIPMAEQPFRQPSPRGSPSAPPSRRSTRRETPPSQPDEPPLPRGNEIVYGKVKEKRGRRGNAAADEGGSVVYAALNHQLPAAAAARPRRPQEEASEYAAIRVKDPSPTRLNYY
ncbi:B- and T-lymphocyte attenuator-like isoform X4 [Sebastes umbrosus]|uniref:B- and T-lymphocyte attenuator-like isoform X4 n=1 Tax=Sebastes umbrosus TaxID=72105 RepID=UPI0018A01825|nr:B- and T-lymphocyte attenuator-like isoform X4 [Sebastes umbrosus]